jgi:hypothetical protein
MRHDHDLEVPIRSVIPAPAVSLQLGLKHLPHLVKRDIAHFGQPTSQELQLSGRGKAGAN